MKFCVSLSCCFPRRQSPPASPYFVEFQVFPFSLPRVSLVPTISRVISNPPTSTIRGGRRSLEELGVDILVEVEDNFMCHSEQISKEDIDNIRENIPACLDNNSLSSQHSIVRGDEASQLIAEHQDLQEMVTFTNNQSFVELKKIGVGAFGVVYSCMWGSRKVAIKKFRSSNDKMKFENEIEMLIKTANHNNIIKLYGYSKDVTPSFFVMELADTSLSEVIHSDDKYNFQEALNWTLQCAEGVEYLHSMTNPIIHRDLKPQNLLLMDQKKILKISDFGMAREVIAAMTVGRGTMRYAAPEVYNKKDGNYTIKCDVFSFSMLLFELLHRELPHSTIKDQQVICYLVGSLKLRPSLQLPESKKGLNEMMQRCWDEDPLERPSMSAIVKGLAWLTQHFPSPITTAQESATATNGCIFPLTVGERPDCFLYTSTVYPLASELAESMIEYQENKSDKDNLKIGHENDNPETSAE